MSRYLVLMLFAAGSAGAQRTSAPAGTPMVCTEAMERFRNEKYQAGRTAHKDVDWKTVDSMMIAQGKRCAANLDVSKVHGAELIDLAGLYSRLGDLDATDRVFGRISSDAAIPDCHRRAGDSDVSSSRWQPVSCTGSFLWDRGHPASMRRRFSFPK